MSTADHCRAMADEAERLASIVSYGRDKVRLREQAASWRAKAALLETQAPEPPAATGGGGLFGWLRRRSA